MDAPVLASAAEASLAPVLFDARRAHIAGWSRVSFFPFIVGVAIT
jgi:hypothetical protein